MHRWPAHQPDGDTPTPLIWLLAGTGEGPPLAAVLLERGWRVLVSVVTPEATRAYPPHPRLELQVGALADGAAIAAVLAQRRPRWVVDATHPFACRISDLLRAACTGAGQAPLRLRRPAVQPPADLRLERLRRLEDLGRLDLRGERLLLAIGSRQLPLALAHSNAAAHHARLLDRPASLQLALAAGLPDGQLACLRPDPRGPGALERALCRRWRISAVLCRQSGGAGEAFWQRLCRELQLRLLLLEQAGGEGADPGGDSGADLGVDPGADQGSGLPLEALLEKLGHP